MDDIRDTQGSRREDSDLNPELPTPSHQGSGGGGLAVEIGTRDEEQNALGGDPEPTRVRGGDKAQPNIPTRNDHEGAQGLEDANSPFGKKQA